MNFRKHAQLFGHAACAAAILLVAGLAGCGKSPEEKKVAAEAAKAAIEAQTTGRLVVKSNRANTIIDAKGIASPGAAASAAVKGAEEGAAEQTLAALPAGKYVLTARAAGWPEIRQDVTVEAGRTTEVTVHFKSGSLRVESDPSGATVKLGDAVLGKTPLAVPQLCVGECQLSLSYLAWPVAVLKTTIAENTETAESVRLPHGKLTVESTPPGAMVLLAGKAAGQTPLTLDPVPAGPKKLTLQLKDFPDMDVPVTVEDRGEVKVSPELGAGFPDLDPPNLLRNVWVPDDPNKLSLPVDALGVYEPRNGIVKNLHRKRLYQTWLGKRYRYAAIVKAYDKEKGRVEFAEQPGELSKFRVMADLSLTARGDKDLAARLVKGATLNVYGRLSAVEEPRWPGKVITFELSAAEALR